MVLLGQISGAASGVPQIQHSLQLGRIWLLRFRLSFRQRLHPDPDETNPQGDEKGGHARNEHASHGGSAKASYQASSADGEEHPPGPADNPASSLHVSILWPRLGSDCLSPTGSGQRNESAAHLRQHSSTRQRAAPWQLTSSR
jgi:hypothetical protein